MGDRIGYTIAPNQPTTPPDPGPHQSLPGVMSILGPDISIRAMNTEITVDEWPVIALLDTGASHCVMRASLAQRLGLRTRPWTLPMVTANGQPLSITTSANVPTVIGDRHITWNVALVPDLKHEIILGCDLLHHLEARIDFKKKQLHLCGSEPIKFTIGGAPTVSASTSSAPQPSNPTTAPPRPTDVRTPLNKSWLHVTQDTLVPARSEVVVGVQAVGAITTTDRLDPRLVYLEPNHDTRFTKPCVNISHGLRQQDHFTAGRIVGHKVVNLTGTDATLPKGYKLLRVTALPDTATTIQLPENTTTVPTVSAVDNEDTDTYLTTPWTDTSWSAAIQSAVPADHPQAAALQQFLTEQRDIFSPTKDTVGTAIHVRHNIVTAPMQMPIRQQPRRRNPHQATIEQDEINKMLAAGVITHSHSPWASPTVLVRKSDGSWRFCVDYRKLNMITVSDTYALPRIDDILDRLGGQHLFSTLDMQAGYWQIPMATEDAAKTAFHGPHGLYEFQRMPFGLKNAPATFQRTMDFVLAGLLNEHCWVYLDDIIVASTNFDQHVRDLQQVFDSLRSAGFMLKLSKCHFAKSSLKFLGHVISKEGVTVDPDKVSALSQMPKPTNVTEVRSFIGGASYFRRFIRDFASIAKPLTDLTKADTPFLWTSECETAFTTLLSQLSTAPILAYPDWTQPFTLATDASYSGLGACLTQCIDGIERPVLFASRKLSDEETRYAVTEIEGAAVVWAFKLLRPYLLGKPFKLITDHIALRSWLTKTNLGGRLARWSLILQEFDFTVEYRKGAHHGNADMLSRLPQPDVSAITHLQHHDYQFGDFVISTTNLDSGPMLEPTNSPRPQVDQDHHSKWRTAQQEDPWCGPLLAFLQEQWQPSNRTDAAALRRQAARFTVVDGILYYAPDPADAPTTPRLALPHSLRSEVLQQLHDAPTAGHFGFDRTVARVSMRFHWPSLSADVQRYCASCVACQKRKSPRTLPAGRLEPIQVSAPFELVGMDIEGPLHTTKAGNKYILVLQDYFTKFARCYPMVAMDALTVATALFKFVCDGGHPTRFLSDQGSQFTSEVLDHFLAIVGSDHVTTTAYHPQTDGLVERLNSTILGMLAIQVSPTQDNWDELLPTVESAYNSSQHSVTGFSPHFLRYGYEFALPLDATLPKRTPHSVSSKEFVARTETRLAQAREIALQRIRNSQEQQKLAYNKRHKSVEFQVGDLVALKTPAVPPGLSPKLFCPWTLPFTVTAREGKQNYRISRQGKSQLVHVQRLKQFYQRQKDIPPATTKPATTQRQDPLPSLTRTDQTESDATSPQPADEHEWFEVETLLDRRASGSGFQYKVHWKGYDPITESTWRAASALPKSCVEEYDSQHPRPIKIATPAAVPTDYALNRPRRSRDGNKP